MRACALKPRRCAGGISETARSAGSQYPNGTAGADQRAEKARKKRKNGFAGIERCDAQANSFADSMRRCEEVDERHHVGQ